MIDEINPNPTLSVEIYDADEFNDDYLGGYNTL